MRLNLRALILVGVFATAGASAFGQTSRSEVGAIVSVLSRLSDSQGRALIRALGAVQEARKADKGSFSLPSAWDLLMNAAFSADKSEIKAIMNSAV